MKKLAIVVGHNSRRQGAMKLYPSPGVSEYTYYCAMADYIAKQANAWAVRGVLIQVFYRTPEPGDITRVYREVDAWGADASIELHFNSFGNPNARGCEVLSSGSAPSMKMAQAVQDALLTTIYGYGADDRFNRGVKVPTNRGRTSVTSGKAPAILIEPFFGSSQADCELADKAGIPKIADAMLEAAVTAMGFMPRKDLAKESRTIKESNKGQVAAAAGGATATVGVAAQAGNAIFGDAKTPAEAASTVSSLVAYLPWAGMIS